MFSLNSLGGQYSTVVWGKIADEIVSFLNVFIHLQFTENKTNPETSTKTQCVFLVKY